MWVRKLFWRCYISKKLSVSLSCEKCHIMALTKSERQDSESEKIKDDHNRLRRQGYKTSDGIGIFYENGFVLIIKCEGLWVTKIQIFMSKKIHEQLDGADYKGSHSRAVSGLSEVQLWWGKLPALSHLPKHYLQREQAVGYGNLKLCWKERTIGLWALDGLKVPTAVHAIYRNLSLKCYCLTFVVLENWYLK